MQPNSEPTISATVRPAWMDVIFASAIGLGFGLSLVRTPATWLWAVVLFVGGCGVYGMLRIRWARRNSRRRPPSQRTSDGVWYLALVVVALVLSGVQPPEQWRIGYALGVAVLLGGAGFLFLRREATRRLGQGAADDKM